MAKRSQTTTTRIAPAAGVKLRTESGALVPEAGIAVPSPLRSYWHQHLLDGACSCDDWAVDKKTGHVIAKGHGSRRSSRSD